MKKFQLVIGSPIGYEELVVYIKIKEVNVCLIQKEEGVDKMKIEFFNENEITLYLSDFLEAIAEAKQELLK